MSPSFVCLIPNYFLWGVLFFVLYVFFLLYFSIYFLFSLLFLLYANFETPHIIYVCNRCFTFFSHCFCIMSVLLYSFTPVLYTGTLFTLIPFNLSGLIILHWLSLVLHLNLSYFETKFLFLYCNCFPTIFNIYLLSPSFSWLLSLIHI